VAVDRIEVHDLRDNTFYATVYLRQPDGGEVALDARPSDAIALALRARAPIRVAQKVVDKARKIDLRTEPSLPNLRASAVPADFPDFPDALEPSDLDLDGEIEPEARARALASGSSLRIERATDAESTYAALLESLGERAFGKWKM
jgi:hypothetical protein